jgi:3'(2'), 5'-bisphosphate nucleotidase
VSVNLKETCVLDDRDKLARLFGLISVRAGRAIMRLRETGTITQYKGDGSPVTAADFRGPCPAWRASFQIRSAALD